MPWWDNLPVIKKPHDACNGTGLIDGQPDPDCGGTGEIELKSDSHDQAQFPIKYVLIQVIDALAKLDAQDTKLDTLETHLDTIEAKIDQLLP